jgi:spore coat protein CotH
MARRIRVRGRALVLSMAVFLGGGGLAGCASDPATTATTAESAERADTAASSELWDSSVVHDIALTFDQADYDALIAAYLDDGEKQWITATVTIDGTTIENVGLRLKGNRTLSGLTDGTATSTDRGATPLSAENPETLPWLIRLDKFVDGQTYDGETDLVVRASEYETAINEAVALDLLDTAGLAAEEAVPSRFTMNGGSTDLRLVVQNPNDEWVAQEFGTNGLLYKAESGGDYSYRGDDPDAYADVFDQEAGEDDLTPLIGFLEFVNESDDATFEAELGQWLDVKSFATYLAFQDLVQNADDISGRGNNSYLYYDPSTKLMTVVSWDLNSSFGGGIGAGAGAGAGGGAGGARPGAGGGRPGGGAAASNVLAERFQQTASFQALYEDALAGLRASLYDSGAAQADIDRWQALLTEQASDLVDAATIEQEAEAVVGFTQG